MGADAGTTGSRAEATDIDSGCLRVGVIANPVSARDVRRVLSNAAGLTLGERANMLLRLVHTLAACAVDEICLMPEREGLRPMLERQLHRAGGERTGHRLPRIRWLEMPVRGSIEDTYQAARMLREIGVRAIMVLGGDGTHRAVAKYCGRTPIVAISSGTNNAFPPMREVTVTALATGLYARGDIPDAVALRPNKCLRIRKHDADGRVLAEDIALVDVGVLNEQILGAKAIGDVDSLRTVLVSHASPEAVGLSGVAAMLQPLDRHEAGALVVELLPAVGPHAPLAGAPRILRAALAPGLICALKVIEWHRIDDTVIHRIEGQAGLLSFDGEREMSFQPQHRLEIQLQENAFCTLDVPACLREAARRHLLLEDRVNTG